jgi:hypothetical protein
MVPFIKKIAILILEAAILAFFAGVAYMAFSKSNLLMTAMYSILFIVTILGTIYYTPKYFAEGE